MYNSMPDERSLHVIPDDVFITGINCTTLLPHSFMLSSKFYVISPIIDKIYAIKGILFSN